MLSASESMFIKKLNYDWRLNAASDYRIVVQATVEKNEIRKYWGKLHVFEFIKSYKIQPRVERARELAETIPESLVFSPRSHGGQERFWRTEKGQRSCLSITRRKSWLQGFVVKSAICQYTEQTIKPSIVSTSKVTRIWAEQPAQICQEQIIWNQSLFLLRLGNRPCG